MLTAPNQTNTGNTLIQFSPNFSWPFWYVVSKRSWEIRVSLN